MSTKIYDAFIVKAKNPTSISTLMNIAQNARYRMLDAFRDNFGKTVLIRLFKIVDLVAFYGDDILEMNYHLHAVYSSYGNGFSPS